MKDPQIEILINQLAVEVCREANAEKDIDRNCRLQNCQERLRQAFMEISGQPYECNDMIKI